MTVLDAHESAPPVGTAAKPARRWGALAGWVGLIAVAALFALVVGALAISAPESRNALDPESAKGSGSLALAELLRDQGTDISVVRTRSAAMAALDDGAMLVMSDPFALSDDAVLELLDGADDAVVLSASSRMLRLLEIGENTVGATHEPLSAVCALPELANVGGIRPERFFSPAAGVTGCFVDADGGAGLLVDERGSGRTLLLEAGALFSNDALIEDGNAALGIALLAQAEKIVWYVPSYADSDIEAQEAPSLAELTPEWVTPAILLLIVAGAVAAVARGQRFGPLVAETLPVTVRASETMQGRARLTARAGDAAHAAQALREGSLRRLAARLGLAASATPAEVADAASDRLRIPRGSLYDLLAGSLPTSDPDLVDAARRLSELEAAVDTAAHVERNTP
ncbi:DUF4350 domain-containing protein [uncultured Microbacterium sp.]|uniref:DUF4350 domain-containing protein n=1 Tax=uncultured Microbacterium sp. TaxID=191216 RepID=UPI002605C9A8|nr:DUF4350 domain-containing protein [uncultured Microbacterium sp.]